MYNKIVLVGNLTRDIELRYTPSGVAVSSTGLAVSRRYTTNGEKKEEVCFVDITFFNRSAEIANQYLKKGSKILVDGRLKLDNWVDNSGSKRSKHTVIVETMQMLDSKSDSYSNDAQPNYNNSVEQQPTHNSNGGNNNTNTVTNKQNSVPVIDLNEDEIPF